MTKRKIMLITVCFAIFAISLLLSRQFFKSAGKRRRLQNTCLQIPVGCGMTGIDGKCCGCGV